MGQTSRAGGGTSPSRRGQRRGPCSPPETHLLPADSVHPWPQAASRPSCLLWYEFLLCRKNIFLG